MSGVPEARRNDTAEVQRYLTESCVTQQRHRELTWKWASLRSHVVRENAGRIKWVLLLEREDGEEIQIMHHGTTNADPCEWELALAAEVWAAAHEEKFL